MAEGRGDADVGRDKIYDDAAGEVRRHYTESRCEERESETWGAGMCVCVCERERERKRGVETERERTGAQSRGPFVNQST